MSKSIRIRWTGHVACMRIYIHNELLNKKPEEEAFQET
jgi:hypothetical protein